MRIKGIVSFIMILVLLCTAVMLWVPGEDAEGATIIADITSNTTWTAAGGPYEVISNIHVTTSNTLTIEAGTKVRFDIGTSITIDSGAKLVASGNESAGCVLFNATKPEYTFSGIILQSSDNEIFGCNFSQGSPAVNIVGTRNVIKNCTFTNSPIGVAISGKNNKIVNSTFLDGVTTGVSLTLGTYNSIENCEIFNAKTGVEFKMSSNNNYLNATKIVGGDNSVFIDTSSNVQINGTAMLNNKYCVRTSGTALLNKLRNCTLLVSTEFAIKASGSLDAKGNFWGTSDAGTISGLVSGPVDASSPLAADPVGLGLPTISSATTWTTPQNIVGGLLVSSDLTVVTSKITFADPAGYNFIYVTGSLNFQGATVDTTFGSGTIFYAKGSSGSMTDSAFSDGFSVLGYTPDLTISGTTFTNGTNALVLRGSDGTEVTDCTFADNGWGIRSVSSSDLTLSGNAISDGFYLIGADNSVITNNYFDTGTMNLISSSNCQISQNNFSLCGARALQLSSISNSFVSDNEFYKNKEGVRINPGSMYNNITNNEFVDNSDAPIYIDNTDWNYVYHNNIYGSFQFTSLGGGINFWNNSLNEGNYWSSYIGEDNGEDEREKGDGIGDTYLPFMGVDDNPFMEPNGWLYPKAPRMLPMEGPVDSDGEYNVTWEESANSDTYVVHQASTNNFNAYEEVYNGTSTQVVITGKEKGMYHYRVRGENDMGSSAWSNSVNVQVNFAPTVGEETVKVELPEDGETGFELNLSTVFTDPDGDILEFTFDTSLNITLEVNETGYLKASAIVANWFGEEEIRFYATDGLFEVNRTILFEVEAVNDPPSDPGVFISPSSMTIDHWQLTNFTAVYTDVDTDRGDMTFNWESNISGSIGDEYQLLNLSLVPGHHEITLNVSDGEFSKEYLFTFIVRPEPKVVEPVPDDDEPTNKAAIALVIGVLVVLMVIVVGVLIYFMMRKKSIETADEISKEAADVEKEAKIKKIKKVATPQPQPGGMPGEDGMPMEDAEMQLIGAGLDEVPEIGPASVGPVMEEDQMPGDGTMGPDEKQKMLDELDELLFADEITEEEYIQKVNEIEGM